MLPLDISPTNLTIIYGIAIFALPPCALLLINYLYRTHTDILTFPEKLSMSTTRRDILYITASCIAYMAMIFCLPIISIDILLLQVFFVTFMLIIACTDFEQQVIFDKINLALAIGGIIYILCARFSLTSHILVGLGSGIIFLLLSILGRGALGGGDIKLMTALGFWLGYQGILQTIILGSILGGAAAFFLLITKRLKRKDPFAYGAYYAIAALIVFLC